MKQQIEPAYVTFEQAKKLKEKEFNKDKIEIECNQGYDFRGDGTHLIKNGRHIQHKLFYSAPEQWQVIEWLRINHGIHLEVSCDVYGELWFVKLEVCSKEVWDDLDKRHNILTAHRKFNNEHKSPQEAYSAAFDYILNDLI
jgi:hypothetical protein